MNNGQPCQIQLFLWNRNFIPIESRVIRKTHVSTINSLDASNDNDVLLNTIDFSKQLYPEDLKLDRNSEALRRFLSKQRISRSHVIDCRRFKPLHTLPSERQESQGGRIKTCPWMAFSRRQPPKYYSLLVIKVAGGGAPPSCPSFLPSCDSFSPLFCLRVLRFTNLQHLPLFGLVELFDAYLLSLENVKS